MEEKLQSDSDTSDYEARVTISDEEIRSLFKQTLRIKAVKLVTEKEYAERIEICTACPALDYGTTCNHCGCLVELKAKLSASKCPYPNEPRWPPTTSPKTRLPQLP